MQHTDNRLEKNMDLALIHEGTFELTNFRTTNKVEEDAEILTGYLKLVGLVPKEFFVLLTATQNKHYEKFFWGTDTDVTNPAIGEIPFDVEAKKHIVQIPGVRYDDNDAVIRKFKLEPSFGEQFVATMEVLIHPKTDAVVGRLAAKQGHDMKVVFKGPREADMFAGEDESNVVDMHGGKGDDDGA